MDLALVSLVLHVDKIDDHQATQVAKSHLASHFYARLDVGLKDEILAVLAVYFVTTGVDVYGDKGLGLLDHDFSTRGKGHLAHEGLLDLALHAKTLEDRDFLGEMVNL